MKAHVFPNFLTPLPPAGQNPRSLAWVHPPPLSCELQRGCLKSQLWVRWSKQAYHYLRVWMTDFVQLHFPPQKEYLWGENRWQSIWKPPAFIMNSGWPLITWKSTTSGYLVWMATFFYIFLLLRVESPLTYSLEHPKWYFGLAYRTALPEGTLWVLRESSTPGISWLREVHKTWF